MVMQIKFQQSCCSKDSTNIWSKQHHFAPGPSHPLRGLLRAFLLPLCLLQAMPPSADRVVFLKSEMWACLSPVQSPCCSHFLTLTLLSWVSVSAHAVPCQMSFSLLSPWLSPVHFSGHSQISPPPRSHLETPARIDLPTVHRSSAHVMFVALVQHPFLPVVRGEVWHAHSCNFSFSFSVWHVARAPSTPLNQPRPRQQPRLQHNIGWARESAHPAGALCCDLGQDATHSPVSTHWRVSWQGSCESAS